MKYFKLIFLGIAMTAFLAACGGNAGHEHHDHDAMQGDSTENADTLTHDFAYMCPMHPDQGGDEPGKCAKCGMDYVKNEKHSEEGHAH